MSRNAAASRGALVLTAAILGSGMSLLDGTAVNVILPIVQRDLHANAQSMQWVVEGYALFLSALVLVGGALGDVYGRRKMFTAGTALFAVSFATAISVATGEARALYAVGGIAVLNLLWGVFNTWELIFRVQALDQR